MSTSSPEDDLLIDLRAFALVMPNYKLSFVDDCITLQSPSPFRWIVRKLWGDGKRKTLDKLKKLVDYSIEFCSSHIEYLTLSSTTTTNNTKKPSSTPNITQPSSSSTADHHHHNNNNNSINSSKCKEKYNRLDSLNAAMKDALIGISHLEQTYLPSVASQINVRLKKLEKQIEINDKYLLAYKHLSDHAGKGEERKIDT